MDKENRIEKIFRERLYDFEYNLDDAGWAEISSRLSSRRRFYVWSGRVAVVMALMLLLGGGIWLSRNMEEETVVSPVMADANRILPVSPLKNHVLALDNYRISDIVVPEIKMSQVSGQNDFRESTLVPSRRGMEMLLAGNGIPDPDMQSMPLSIPKSLRKWRIGMGGGNLGLVSVGTNDIVAPTGDLNSPSDPGPDDREEPKILSRAQSIVRYEPESSVRVKHLTPLSFGVSLSYPLGKRWSFQTGLTYTYLRSKWKDEYTGHVVGRQRLHLLGIPLAVNYQFTNWRRSYCYLNFGVLGEVNIAGQLNNSYGHYDIRIPGVLWTANARVGIAYPLIRFISVYAEGGVCYYFEYSGNIETIRSEDAFNLTGQIGFRLNF